MSAPRARAHHRLVVAGRVVAGRGAGEQEPHRPARELRAARQRLPHPRVPEHPQPPARDLHDRASRRRPGGPGRRTPSAWTASGASACSTPRSVSRALDGRSRTVTLFAPRSAATIASRRGDSTVRAPAIPTELSTVTAPALSGNANGSGMYGDTGGGPPVASRRIATASRRRARDEAPPLGRARRHLVRPAQVDAADLPADGPDRVEALRAAAAGRTRGSRGRAARACRRRTAPRRRRRRPRRYRSVTSRNRRSPKLSRS